MFGGTSKAQQIRYINLQTPNCKSCEEKKTLQLVAWTSYIHVMFIPFVTEGKKAAVICSNCGKEYEIKKQGKSIQDLANNEKMHIKIPAWHFIGAALLVIAIVSGILYNQFDNKRDAELVQEPMKGDYYEYEAREGWYSCFKIVDVSDDSVFVRYNSYEIDSKIKIDEIDFPENYEPWLVSIGRNNLEKMYEDGIIFEIKR